jgi:hypothetical protein
MNTKTLKIKKQVEIASVRAAQKFTRRKADGMIK